MVSGSIGSMETNPTRDVDWGVVLFRGIVSVLLNAAAKR
jgi:hypothetical protein